MVQVRFRYKSTPAERILDAQRSDGQYATGRARTGLFPYLFSIEAGKTRTGKIPAETCENDRTF